ncbi:MAG: TrkH family potassium uptake protein [Paludibacteraceae bacterium]|nr:TrkH family potassium uptake protein [Paludibacteraceae bacterium]
MTRAFNTRLVVKTQGALLLIESVFMAIATAVSFFYNDPDDGAFLISTLLTLGAGLLGLLIGHNADSRVGEREGYVIVALVWVVFSAFGMLPYYLSGQIPSFTNAWFETMSGFTTTGATILGDIERLTHGALFWRAMTQWLGGMGIIVLSIALLPMFGLGGMQLYAAEVTGLSYEKLSPRIADTAKHLWITYILLTAIEVGLLWIEGMPLFDSVCHSFSTVATGGFSTKNLSIAYYTNPAIHYTIAAFTLLAGINFALIILIFRGKPSRVWHDEETHWYLGAVAASTVVLTIGLTIQWLTAGNMSCGTGEFFHHLETAFREGFATTVFTMTSCGFAIADYTTWAPFLWVLVFFLMFTGASSGSTSGGIKWVRLMIFAKSGFAEFKRRIHPNAVVPVKLNGKPITQQTTNNVMAFMVFYILILAATTLVFCATGVDFDESIGAAVSAIGNIGPSIGQYGPAGTYELFPPVAKWVMTLVMLIGRLEIFTVLLLFTRALWKK